MGKVGFRLAVLVFAAVLAACSEWPPGGAGGEKTSEKQDFATAIKGFTRKPGLFDLYVKPDEAKVLALLPAPDGDGTMLRTIHAVRLTAGLGSNPLGLDRGWGNWGELLRFRRLGGKVIAEMENPFFRATTENGAEKRAVRDSFARSFLWSAPVMAVAGDGRVLVDISGLLTKDVLGLARRLKEEKGEAFTQDMELSLPDQAAALAFPDNVELEAHLTFTSPKPGPQVQATAPWPSGVTLTVHHSFVRLPDDGYRPRRADPRTGTFAYFYYDYGVPLEASLLQPQALRHRLEYREPGNPESGVAEPIVFYVDRGAPSPVREALIEGAGWWAEAFEAAGFSGGFKIELLPEGVHPLDIRYNVIQWVHRQTRGYSYGGGIIDPRTGEMIKGHVILGSQRVRHDRMIFEGLAGADRSGTGAPDDPVELALDRIRQLAAHEVGHALGMGHNFAASTTGRASVMDYPAPWIIARADGTLDFSKAYDTGIGEWDKVAVTWLYGVFDPDREEAELDRIVEEARAGGLLFVAPRHSRTVDSAHPHAAVWDNGPDPVTELANVMAVRRVALGNFSPDAIGEGRPLSDLRKVLVPVYLYHRYQVNAAARFLGGMSFRHGRKGREEPHTQIVPAADQRRALTALLATLDPAELDLPENILVLMEPETFGFTPPGQSEMFASRTASAFDFTAAVETAADLTFAALFDPARVERLVQFHVRDREMPSLDEVLEQVEATVFAAGGETEVGSRRAEIARLVRGRYVHALMALDGGTLSQAAAATIRARLAALADRLGPPGTRPAGETAHGAWLAGRIRAHLSRPAPERELATEGPDTPPGSPIGALETCWHCE